MKKRTAVLFVAAGMMLNACNPLETSKPIEATAATVTEAATTVAETTSGDTVAFEMEAVIADSEVSKGIVGKKKGETNPLRPTLEAGKLRPKIEKEPQKEVDNSDSYSSDPVITPDGYQSYLDVMALPFTDPPEGLCSYRTNEFWFDGLTWYLEIWTDARPGADGWYDWDDQNRFYIRTYNDSSNEQFVLMDDMVSIGYPSVDVYDDGKWLHIIISDFRTATAKITDYSYLSEENFFSKTVILEQDGINYMTGIDVK